MKKITKLVDSCIFWNRPIANFKHQFWKILLRNDPKITLIANIDIDLHRHLSAREGGPYFKLLISACGKFSLKMWCKTSKYRLPLYLVYTKIWTYSLQVCFCPRETQTVDLQKIWLNSKKYLESRYTVIWGL